MAIDVSSSGIYCREDRLDSVEWARVWYCLGSGPGTALAGARSRSRVRAWRCLTIVVSRTRRL